MIGLKQKGVQNYRPVPHLHLGSTYQAFNIAQAQGHEGHHEQLNTGTVQGLGWLPRIVQENLAAPVCPARPGQCR